MPPQQSTTPRRRSLETFSVWALLATLVAGVFAFIPFTAISLSTTKAFLLAAGALVTLALYVLARLSRGNIIFPPFALVGALWLPALAYALSATFSSVPFVNTLWGTALEPDTLGFMLIAAGLGTLTAFILRRSEHYNSFLRTGAFVFGIVVLLELAIVIVGQFAPSAISPAFSFVGSFNDLAFLLGLGVISVLLTFRFLELSGRARRALLASGTIALFLIALANSSVVWVLVALVSLGLFVEAVLRRRPRADDADFDDAVTMGDTSSETDKGGHSLVLPLTVLAVSLFFLIGGTLGGALANALHVNVLNVRPSWQATFSVAHQSYATAPLFGTGPGTFGAQWLKYRDASLNSTPFWNVDFSSGIGFVPTSFVTTGIVGALAWIAFLLLFIVLGLRMLIVRAPEDAFIRHVAILSFVGSLYLFIIAIFDLPSVLILALAFVFAGLFVSTMRFATGSRQWGVIFSRSPRLGFMIVFSLTILLLAAVVAAYTLATRSIATAALAQAGADFNAGNLDAADRSAQNSISFVPSAAAYQVEAGIAAARLGGIAASSTMSAAAAQQAFQTALSAGINAALTATRLDPSNYQNWLVLGNLYAQAVPLGVSSAYDSAKASYQKAQTLNPTNPQIPYILAQLDIAHKDTKQAEEDLKAAIALKQDYTAAIFLLSQLEVQDGNVKDALDAALAAAYFAPNDPNILFQVGILRAAESDYAGAVTALSGAVTANPEFANARYFLAAVYAKQGDLKSALAQLQAIAALSADNAKAVATQLTALEAGKNPFPANLLSISPAPVK
ncbi:MAG: tetratricopeptide repeat protein [Minisyncoccota bacterium]